MRKALFLILFPALLMGTDTLWVLRVKPPDRTARNIILLPGWKMIPTRGTKVNIWGRSLVRDSLGRIDTTEYALRVQGTDTTRNQLVYTTVDSLPKDWGKAEFKLGAEGKLIKK